MSQEIRFTETEQMIEAVLFASGYPVTYDRLSDLLGLTPAETQKCVEAFAVRYNAPEAGRGIQLLTYDRACQLCSKEQYRDSVREALGIRRGGTLSASSLEVLAIIAYHQPVTRAYIEQIRGVDCSYAISSLQDKGLIDTKGRLDVPGKPFLYVTTADFLRAFGLSSISELPPMDFFTQAGENEQILFDMGDTD